jgi:hypothetical protein
MINECIVSLIVDKLLWENSYSLVWLVTGDYR